MTRLQRQPHFQRAAVGNLYILPIGILHGLQGHDLVARGVDDFNAVANSKAVFHLYLQPAIACFGFADFTHELAALRLRTAGFVVLGRRSRKPAV